MENRAAAAIQKLSSEFNSRPNSGLAARDLAVSALYGVLHRKQSFDEAFAIAERTRPLEPRDRALAHLIALTALRRHGELKTVLAFFLTKPLPDNLGRLDAILLAASAQLLFLNTPPHAAISIAVDQCKPGKDTRRFDKLVNAVLRRVSTEGRSRISELGGARLNVPRWLFERWVAEYGEITAGNIAQASLVEAPLDVTVKGDVGEWASRLSGVPLPPGTVRILQAGRIADLPGFAEGGWWVQDAAAALPVKLFGDLKGKTAVDLCAAPGGKTAQLVMAGATVTAIDKSPGRLKRLAENLARLNFNCRTIPADVLSFANEDGFDAVLLDAPCSATGTIRRHPDILHLKRADDIAALAKLQSALLVKAAALVRPGGMLVYCTCSLEREEGRDQIAKFLAQHPAFERFPVSASEFGGDAAWISPDGDLRTLPCHHVPGHPGIQGLDGFYAARLVRK